MKTCFLLALAFLSALPAPLQAVEPSAKII
jgi:hypothetical protein